MCPALLQHLQDWLRGDPDPPGSASGPPLQPVFVMSLSPPGKFCGSSGCLGPLQELALTLHFGKMLLECLLSTNTREPASAQRAPQAGGRAGHSGRRWTRAILVCNALTPPEEPWDTVAHRGTPGDTVALSPATHARCGCVREVIAGSFAFLKAPAAPTRDQSLCCFFSSSWTDSPRPAPRPEFRACRPVSSATGTAPHGRAPARTRRLSRHCTPLARFPRTRRTMRRRPSVAG